MKQREFECRDKAICPAPARKSNFKRVSYALFAAAMALFPLRAWADSDDPKRFIPRLLVSSTIPRTATSIPMASPLCRQDFRQGDC